MASSNQRALTQFHDEVRTHLGKQALARRLRPAQQLVGLLVDQDVQVGALGQVLQQRTMAKGGVLGEIQRKPALGASGIRHQDGQRAAHLLGRSHRDGLARTVDEAPVPFRRGRSSECMTVRLVRQGLDVRGDVVERARAVADGAAARMLGGADDFAQPIGVGGRGEQAGQARDRT